MNEAPNDSPQPRMGPIHTGKLSHIESSFPLGFSEPQRHKRILVVDDNSDIVFTLRLELERDPNIQVYGYDNPVT